VGSALAPDAFAADIIPSKAPMVVKASPAWTWTGFYAGVHLGYAWQQSQASGAYALVPFTNSTNPSGFMGGGQIGYNWQSGMAVFGVEADISGLAASSSTATAPLPAGTTATSSGKINWLGTVRGRLGAAIGGNTMIYATGGWAFGGVQNTNVQTDGFTTGTWDDRRTRHGYAVGGGIEHMLASNWSLRLEGMYVDLGQYTSTSFTGACVGGCQPVTFSNKATIVRAGVNVKFGP
jgi:outer membrane immunogenic protein